MKTYYVKGCIDNGIDTVTVEDDVAQFWTLYERDADGLSQGVIDCTFREDAEAAMAVYKERDQLQEQVKALAIENAALKISRAVLAENTLEACNSIASAGFRHEAIMRGLMESTGNGNRYPKPITTLVDEALRKIETPATDTFVAKIEANAVDELWSKSLCDTALCLQGIGAFEKAEDRDAVESIIHDELKERCLERSTQLRKQGCNS